MFGVVGASGVLVNLGCLFAFADALGVQTNIASALAIEVSILSNFLLNDRWTFRDRRHAERSLAKRAADFHLVSLVGAAMQLSVFVASNVAWMLLLSPREVSDAYFGGGAPWFDRFIRHPLLEPPDVGALKYVSQLLGIGLAVLWNYLANFHLTWRTRK
jgi:putative flippase GtrA